MNEPRVKFRPTGNYVKVGYDVWECKDIYREEFIPTRAYVKWLKEQAEIKQQRAQDALKSKLEYQMKTYGEVDPVDYASYMNMVMNAYK